MPNLRVRRPYMDQVAEPSRADPADRSLLRCRSGRRRGLGSKLYDANVAVPAEVFGYPPLSRRRRSGNQGPADGSRRLAAAQVVQPVDVEAHLAEPSCRHPRPVIPLVRRAVAEVFSPLASAARSSLLRVRATAPDSELVPSSSRVQSRISTPRIESADLNHDEVPSPIGSGSRCLPEAGLLGRPSDGIDHRLAARLKTSPTGGITLANLSRWRHAGRLYG